MSSPAKALEKITVASNSQDVKSVVEAVNATIRTEAIALAKDQGIEEPSIQEYTIGEIFEKYSYRCRRVKPAWYHHTFTPKAPRTRK